ncbi:MAG: glycosyl transferase [Bacteroidales bacterium]|nr:glycosyl transferase [Bacteroidales bacterium]
MEYISPDYIFEVSWEVCNKIGGIYTVLSTRAKTLQKSHKDKIIFIGPDVWSDSSNPFFIETKTPLQAWKKQAEQEGLNVKIGRWDIPGKPIAILVDFEPFFEHKNQLYADMWEWYQIESLHGYGDYDEACIFAYASALVMESLYKFIGGESQKVIAHFNEWTTGMGALHVQKKLPMIGTVFTTHATSIGRSIAGNHLPLYDNLNSYNGDEMAHRLNMVAKHSLEKQTARFVDCFTTVSDITAVECEKLLDKTVYVVTPNGFERDFVPKSGNFKLKREHARHQLATIVEKLTGSKPKEDAFFVATSGRYEYKNKGIDLYIDALNRMKESDKLKKEVCAFVMVPGHVFEARQDLSDRCVGKDKTKKPLDQPYITHWLHNMEQDLVVNQMKWLNFNNEKSSKVKLIFIPIYLTGSDAIFKESYYDLLIGMDATVFPSYYEPWGYTPLESVAFSIPTITTSLSGFGVWANKTSGSTNIESGVSVINRTDYNQIEVAEGIREDLMKLVNMTDKEMKTIRDNAFAIALEADWDHFIKYYTQAYHIALKNKNA